MTHRMRNAEWRARYTAHLQSEQWRVTRLKVFSRAHHICEGCGERKGVDVHHLTYDHMGNELLFELVLLCESCHDRVHADRPFRAQCAVEAAEETMPATWEELRRRQGLPADGEALAAQLRGRKGAA